MIFYCDGSYRPQLPGKPGFAAWSAWELGQEIKCWKARINVVDSIQAEFLAIISALQWAEARGCQKAVIVSDSKVAIWHIIGRMKTEKYARLRRRAIIMAVRLGKVLFRWVPREENHRADQLCRKAAERYKKKAA